MTATYDVYRRLAAKPLGRQAFSLGYMAAVPYFSTVRPWVQQIAPHHAVVRIHRRWRLRNHLGTVHAIAVANGLEAAMGLLAEATVPAGLRWLPRGLELQYLAKTTGDVTCAASTEPADWHRAAPFDVAVRVTATLDDGTVVVRGVIPIYVTAAADTAATPDTSAAAAQ